MREFNELEEDWLLDFVPIDDAVEGPRSVLAAAIAPDLVGQIQETCHTAGLKPRRLVLRPCAAASLFARARPGESGELRLLVDLLSDEADLTVMSDRRVVFLRTTRLSGDPLGAADHVPTLLTEIRRTIAAAQNQLGGRRVESIVLCGSDPQHAALAKAIEGPLGISTIVFDPFTGVELSRSLEQSLPDQPGRFAPLMGMLLAEMERTGHAIDFLHPRRPPPAPSRRRKYIAAGIAVAVLVAGYFTYDRVARALLTAEVARLDRESTSLDEGVAGAAKLEKKAGDIQKWTATNVPWLDELAELSQHAPPAQEVLVTKINLSPAPQNSKYKGKIDIEGYTRTKDTIKAMQEAVRDPTRSVQIKDSGQDISKKPYSWRFTASILVGAELPAGTQQPGAAKQPPVVPKQSGPEKPAGPQQSAGPEKPAASEQKAPPPPADPAKQPGAEKPSPPLQPAEADKDAKAEPPAEADRKGPPPDRQPGRRGLPMRRPR
jgi:hypothetical protein